MELMNQDLAMMFENSAFNFTEEHLIRVTYNSICALAFLHEANVMHRDIKPSNLLVNSDCNVKIGDFGLARNVIDLNIQNVTVNGILKVKIQDKSISQTFNSKLLRE